MYATSSAGSPSRAYSQSMRTGSEALEVLGRGRDLLPLLTGNELHAHARRVEPSALAAKVVEQRCRDALHLVEHRGFTLRLLAGTGVVVRRHPDDEVTQAARRI